MCSVVAISIETVLIMAPSAIVQLMPDSTSIRTEAPFAHLKQFFFFADND